MSLLPLKTCYQKANFDHFECNKTTSITSADNKIPDIQVSRDFKKDLHFIRFDFENNG